MSFLYGNASEQFATGAWNWPALTVWGMLVSSGYLPRANSDVNVSDVPASAILARVGPMTSMSVTNGVCAGVLPQFLSLLSASAAAAIVLYINSGLDSTSQLIYYSSDGKGFPLALQGFNYAIANDLSQGGWFQV